jgi:hypothetical protein
LSSSGIIPDWTYRSQRIRSVSDLNDLIIHTKAELLFPAHLISSLRELRGDEWRALVDRVAALPETHPDSLAFVLMMIEMDGCLKCNSNNYKFLRGCFLCATQTIQSFKGTDDDLLELYGHARHELNLHLTQGIRPGDLSLS